ncbi:hypothetical protein BN946_scf184895.g11 [Trametes cinnabarina]|uniref:Uncharacterized protein n=1 Tax=Pycnoporus cinnabarinus TaxID=5643 RepID=A0A060SM19_PYCCI|nr:hypothetical protein BN946_scf184895.g11 [Trametes cinnabarina]
MSKEETWTMAAIGAGYPPRESSVVDARPPRVRACVEAPGRPVHPYEDSDGSLPVLGAADAPSGFADARGVGGPEHGGATTTRAQEARGGPRVVSVIFDLIALVRRRYFSLEALGTYLALDALRE